MLSHSCLPGLAPVQAHQMPDPPNALHLLPTFAVVTLISRLVCACCLQVLSNAVLLVDKPVRWSGADVVRQLKVALKMKRICFGVPLDMEASGLLIILLGG